MDMTDKAIEKIAELGRTTQKIEFAQCDQEPEGVYYVRNVDNGIPFVTKVRAEPPLREHVAVDLNAIVDEVKFMAASDPDLCVSHGSGPVVWYARENVTLVYANQERRNRMTYQLRYSPQLMKMQEFADTETWHDHASFLRLLRTTLKNAITEEELLNRIKTIKFVSGKVEDSSFDRGKTSVGKQAQAEHVGVGVLKDWYTFKLPVFDNAPNIPDMQRIECAFEIDPDRQRFMLTPLPQEIEKAIVASEALIGSTLKDWLGVREIKGSALKSINELTICPVLYGIA